MSAQPLPPRAALPQSLLNLLSFDPWGFIHPVVVGERSPVKRLERVFSENVEFWSLSPQASVSPILSLFSFHPRAASVENYMVLTLDPRFILVPVTLSFSFDSPFLEAVIKWSSSMYPPSSLGKVDWSPPSVSLPRARSDTLHVPSPRRDLIFRFFSSIRDPAPPLSCCFAGLAVAGRPGCIPSLFKPCERPAGRLLGHLQEPNPPLAPSPSGFSGVLSLSMLTLCFSFDGLRLTKRRPPSPGQTLLLPAWCEAVLSYR